MVDIVLKLAGAEVSVTTANTINSATLFRVFAPSAATITVKDANTVTIGSMSMPADFVEIMTKRATDTVEATVAIKCTPVAWR